LEHFGARRIGSEFSHPTKSETDARKIADLSVIRLAASLRLSKETSMRNLRLISTAAALLLLGVGAVSAQTMNTDKTPTPAPATQQNLPAEKMAPASKSDQLKAPETTGQTAPMAPEVDKDAPATAATKGSSDVNGSANVKNKNGAGAASRSGKSAAEGKRSTTGQGTVNEGVVSGPRHRHYRHYSHHRHCWTNIFGYRNCW
jgi:hypothetical protein